MPKNLVRHVALVVFAASAVFACSSSETVATTDASTTDASTTDASPTTDAATDTAASCMLHDGACSPGCCEQSGNRYDETHDCFERPSQIIGCTPKPASTGCGMLGVIGCAITPDGTWYTGSTAAGWTPPMACSDALSAKVTSAKPCADADAASD